MSIVNTRIHTFNFTIIDIHLSLRTQHLPRNQTFYQDQHKSRNGPKGDPIRETLECRVFLYVYVHVRATRILSWDLSVEKGFYASADFSLTSKWNPWIRHLSLESLVTPIKVDTLNSNKTWIIIHYQKKTRIIIYLLCFALLLFVCFCIICM